MPISRDMAKTGTIQPFNIESTFSRTGNAYDPYGVTVASGVDRHSMLVPTGTVTNLLTGTQSDGGDTNNPELLTLNQQTGTSTLGDTTGFTSLKSATLTSSTEQAHTGTRSLKVETPNAATAEGVTIDAATVSASTAYIGGCWVYVPNGATMYFAVTDDTDNVTIVPFTGTGAWQWVEGAITTDAHTSLKLKVYTNAQAGITFYVDGCRLGKTDTAGISAVNSGTITVSPYISYQGLRSFKIVTTTDGYSGEYTGLINGGGANTYTFSAYVYAPNGNPFCIRMYDGGGAGFVGETNYTGTGTWQYVTTTITATNGTQLRCYVQNRSAGGTAQTLYVDKQLLETGSTAHNWAYGGSSYPLGYSLESGLLVEEATTNLCTANVSTGGDTSGDTTGFTLTTGAVLSITTDYYKCGTKSLKIVTDGSANMQGALTTVSVTAGQSYTFSSWIKAPLGIIFMLYIGGTTTIYTGTGDWQYCKCTFTAGATTVYPSVLTWTPQATTMYVDMVQLEQKAYPSSWTLGGTTRNAETMTIPSSVLNIDTSGYSNLLPSAQATSLSSGSPYTTGTLVAGVAYTFSCGTGSYELSGGRGTVTPSNPITVTPGAVTITLTGDSTLNQLSATSSARSWIPGGTQSNTGAGTIEAEIYMNTSLKEASAKYVFDHAANTKNRVLMYYSNGNAFKGLVGDNVGTNNTVTHNYVGTVGEWVKCSLRFGEPTAITNVNGSVGGESQTTSTGTVYLPNSKGTIYLLTAYSGGNVANTLIRNVVVSKTKRSDSEITARAGNTIGFGNIDKYTAAQGDLRYDLTFKGMVK